MQVLDAETARIVSNKLCDKRKRLASALALAVGLSGSVVQADTIYSEWNGSSNTTWSNAGNWNATTGVPSSTVGALFDTTFTNQPNLTAAASTNGIWMNTGVDQNVTINATAAYTLTLGGATYATMSGVTTDLLMTDNGGDTLTFGPNITLKYGHNNPIFTIDDGGTMVVAGSIYTTNGSGPVVNSDGTGTLDITGNLVSGGGGSFTLNDITMILQQNNTSTGGISANTGTLVRLNAPGAINSGGSVSLSGATLQMRTDTSTTFTGNYNFNSSTALLNLDHLTSAGTNNTVTLSGTVLVNNAITMNLTAGNGYNLAISGNVNLGNGYSSTSTLNPTGTYMAISGNVNAVSASTTSVSQGLNLSGNTSGNSISGNIGDGVVDSHGTMPLSVTKTSSSIWTLSGQNTYSGNTSVSAGTLLIDGNSSGATGAVSVTGGTLGGDGTIGGITTVSSSGTIAPGDATGTLTFSQNLTVTGATASFSGGDLAAVDGTLNLLSTWKLNLNSGFQDGGSVTLFTFGTAGTLNLSPTINDSNLGFTPSESLSLSEVGDTIVLNGISAIVPEPATLGLLAMGAMTLLTRRRA